MQARVLLGRIGRPGRVALALALVGLLCELGGYIALRLTSPYRDLAEYYLRQPAHEFDPYRVIRLNPNHRLNGVVHDAQGFRRSSDVAKEKPAGTIRVFLMGASTAYGTGPVLPFPSFVVTNEETLDAQLERLLAARFPSVKFEVINAGVAGYRVFSHWTYLNQVILDYDPDVVLFLDGNNDHFFATDAFNEFDYDHLALDALNKPSLRSAVTQFFLFAARHSYALTVIESRVRRLIDERLVPKGYGRAVFVSQPLDDHLLALYRRTARRTWASIVRQNCRLLQDHGVRAVVMLQPQLQFKQSKPMTPEEDRIAAQELSMRPPGHRQYWNFVKPVTIELLNNAIAGTDATFIDLTDAFGGVREQVYGDFCHLTSAGYAALSRYIMPSLAPIIEDVAVRRGLGGRSVVDAH